MSDAERAHWTETKLEDTPPGRAAVRAGTSMAARWNRVFGYAEDAPFKEIVFREGLRLGAFVLVAVAADLGLHFLYDHASPLPYRFYRFLIHRLTDGVVFSVAMGSVWSMLWRVSRRVDGDRARLLAGMGALAMAIGVSPLLLVVADLQVRMEVASQRMEVVHLLSDEIRERAKAEPGFDYKKEMARTVAPAIKKTFWMEPSPVPWTPETFNSLANQADYMLKTAGVDLLKEESDAQ
jgi:hypothetical protein